MSPRSIGVFAEPSLLTSAFLDADLAVGSANKARFESHLGGSATATAVIAARLGAPVSLFAVLDTQAPGQAAAARLAAEPLTLSVIPTERSRSCFVLVSPDGERSIITDPGTAYDDAVAAYTKSLLPPSVIATWSLFHISLSSLASLAARETVSRVAAAGIPISIDAGSPLSIRSYGSVLTAALGNSKPAILFANEEEAAELTSTGLDRALSATQFIVKRGSAKTSLYDAAGVEISLNPEPVKVVDTTGAGDAFAAGFLSAHLRDARPEDCIDAAHAAAAAAIGIEGPGI